MESLQKKIENYFCLPGDGVYTVHTGADKKESYQNKAFKSDLDKRSQWIQNIHKLENTQNKIFLLGITSDTGGGIQRGANWGPLFVREKYASSFDLHDFVDLGDIRTIPHLLHDKYLNNETISSCRRALYNDETSLLPVSPLSIVSDFAKDFFSTYQNKKLFSLGGDHSVSHPLVTNWVKEKRKLGKKVAVIHFDAHTDLMKERLGIDICFGSWAYHVVSLLESPKDLIQIGVRSSGRDRGYWESSLGINQIWAREVKERGIQQILYEVKNYLKDNYDEIYISFDIDALDKSYAGATGTPEDAGLELYEVISFIDELKMNVTGADLVEVAPFVNQENLMNEPHQTLTSAALIMNSLIRAMQEGN